MSSQKSIVRMFGALHTIRKESGLPSVVEMEIPDGGCSAIALAARLGLPPDKIEAVFVNRKVYTLDHHIEPGDRVGFVPTGIPGSARGLLGIFHPGKQSAA